MSNLDCGHVGPGHTSRVCSHLLAASDGVFHKRFTGAGLDFDLVCPACRQNPGELDGHLSQACPECFRRVEGDGCWDGIIGTPQILERPSNLRFRHEVVTLSEPLDFHVVDIQPLLSESRCVWVVLTADARLLRLDLESGSVRPIASLPESKVDLSKCVALHFSEWDRLGDSRAIAARRELGPVALHLSDCGRVAAVVHTHGRHGVVVDLATGRKTMDLDRGDYHEDVSAFPVAFTNADDRLLVIHGTDWNRLDVSDAMTGELLTQRSPTSYRRDEARPEHYLDYFHCSLVVSPDGEFVADNGWVWHPVGEVVTWSVRRWLSDNVWESEDGPSRKLLCWRTYYWDGPLCWTGGTELAVFGYGADDEWLTPAACIYDAVSGKMARWFAGPNGRFFFDRYLFSCDRETGTSAWDVATGERVVHDPFCPNRNHPRARVFLTLRPDNTFVASRLEDIR